jgi:precorrin-2 dehydrogenase/sirohydrochlorin ferrochelatase
MRGAPYFPIFLDLSNQNVVVVGGGGVAERKIKNLLAYGCMITVISPRLTPYLRQLVAQGTVHRVSLQSLDKSLDHAFMVIAATNDPEVNSRVASQAKERGILVNVVDQPRDCNFIMPSIVKRGDLQIAISTGGKSPALAREIRKEMDGRYGPRYAPFLELLGLVRAELLAQRQPSSENRVIFQRLIGSDLLDLMGEGNWDEVRATLRSILGQEFPLEHMINRVCGKA